MFANLMACNELAHPFYRHLGFEPDPNAPPIKPDLQNDVFNEDHIRWHVPIGTLLERLGLVENKA